MTVVHHAFGHDEPCGGFAVLYGSEKMFLKGS